MNTKPEVGTTGPLSTGEFVEWIVPVLFVISAAWMVWSTPAYIMAFGEGTDAMRARYGEADIFDWVALIASPILFVAGVITARRAKMEYEDWGLFDRISVFVGRATMMLVILLVSVMFYEVVVRYVFEKPTIWASELSLWIAGFIFLFSGLYAMQQRSHIRIFLLYDLMPRWLQKVCDSISTLLIVLFTLALIYGGYGEATQKFARWETFGTAFDPPIPATLKILVLVFVTMVALQSISNLIRDWHKAPEVHTDEPDAEEIERLRRAVGAEGVGSMDVTRGAHQHAGDK